MQIRVSSRSTRPVKRVVEVLLISGFLTAMVSGPAHGQCQANDVAKIVASNGESFDSFGGSVSISGNTAVIGAAGRRSTGGSPPYGAGWAYVFERQGCQWVEVAELSSSDLFDDDEFGCSVTIDGDTIVVGAAQNNGGAGSGFGAAYVFVRPAGGWSSPTPILETQKLTAGDGSAGDLFGISVDICGDTIVVGATLDDSGPGSYSGSAYVFKRGAGVWAQVAKLTASDAVAGDRFGGDVAVDGVCHTIVVGADRASNGGPGAAYVFEEPCGGWVDMVDTVKLTASDGTAGDRFGLGVAVKGDIVSVGAFVDDDACSEDPGCDSGSAYVFVRPAGGWSCGSSPVNECAKLLASDGIAKDMLGISVAIAEDGTVVVGTEAHRTQSNNPGAAYVYGKPAGGWCSVSSPVLETAKLTAFDGAPGDQFGVSLSISGGTLLVGANTKNNGIGAAYVFGGLSDCNGNGVLDTCDIADGTSQDFNGNGIPDECECCIPGDCNGDGVVNGEDIPCFVEKLLGG